MIMTNRKFKLRFLVGVVVLTNISLLETEIIFGMSLIRKIIIEKLFNVLV